MARDEAITAIRFPIRLLTVACLLTIMAFAWFVWIIFDARRDTEMFTDRLSRIEQLRGVIVHLDEVLTMSARMAAATGDLRWEERYHHFEPQLGAAIKETIKIGAGSFNIKAATRTDEANIKLVEMENRAFALVRAGRKEAAQTVLFSPEYETQKQIYAEGITSFTSQIRREFDESLRDDQRIDLLSIIAAVVAGGISFVAWLSAARVVRRWRARLLDSFHQRAEAEENLRQAHAGLEVRVQERTADLANTNETLQAEISERKQAEEALHRSETKFRTLYDSTSDAVMLLDEKGFFDCNQATLAVFGCATREEFCSKHPADVSPPVQPDGTDSRTLAGQRIATAMEKGSHHFEWMHQRAGTGETFPADVLLSAMELDGKRVLQAVVRDITARKRSEESLRVQSAALEAAANAIVITDHNGTIQSVNLAFTALTGYTAPEAVGQNPRLLKSGKQDDTFYRKLWQTISSGQVWSGELTNRRKDGSLYVEEMTITPLRNADGTIGRFIAIKQDATERKRAEDALRQSEEQFRAMFELASVGIAQADPRTGQWLRVNKKMCEITGYSVGELLQMRIADITHPEDRQSDREAFERVVRGEAPAYRMEKRYIRKDGALAWVNVNMTIIRDAAGQPMRTMAAIEDITGRKQAEIASLRLAAIVESLGDAVIGKDLNSSITSWNKGAEKIFGYAASEMIGTSIMRLIPAGRQDEENQILGKIQRGEGVEHFETLRQTKDGRLIDVSVTTSPIKDATGKVIGVSKVARDITARKELEAQLFQSQKLETVGKLAGGVAHEFNSIMTAIIGHSELMLRDLPSGDPLVQNAAGIRRAAERAATLTRQLLAYGRRAFLRPEALDLNQVMAGTEGMVRQIMGGNVDMRIVPAEDLRAVKADAGQIEQVIMNLAMNARAAMPNGGKLTLETANIAFDQEHVGRDPELKPGDYVMLAITDTGTGMSAEVKARAFEPFFTTKDVGQGTGLGLSTCYGIIKQSGGHISVYSEPGRGTTFKIYLPPVESQTKIPIPRLDSPDLPRGMETILLVEDDPALREMAAILLRRLGYTVLAAANGIEALSLKQPRDNGHVDLLFTDVVMPHMSGQELSERVRALYPHTRTLFTSAYTENAIVHQGVLNKGVALLQKPFTPSALARKLREVLDQPGAPKPDLAQKTSGFTKITDGV
jgi:PAS domain S-box-containing protein